MNFFQANRIRSYINEVRVGRLTKVETAQLDNSADLFSSSLLLCRDWRELYK